MDQVTITRHDDGQITVTSTVPTYKGTVKLIGEAIAKHAQDEIDRLASLTHALNHPASEPQSCGARGAAGSVCVVRPGEHAPASNCLGGPVHHVAADGGHWAGPASAGALPRAELDGAGERGTVALTPWQ